MNKVACFSHNTDNWRTPLQLYNYFVNDLGCIDLFPYCSKYDQYENKGYFNKTLFINPPYSHLNTKKFKEYIILLLSQNNTIFLLIPSRTDTKIFHFLSNYLKKLVFFKGRLHFNDGKCAPFPSCLMVLRYECNKWASRVVSFCSVEEFIRYG